MPAGIATGSTRVERSRSLSGCPVCEQPIPSAATACTSCGYPTALALDALRALSEPEPPGPAPPAPRATSPPRRRAARPPPSPEEQLIPRIAQEVDANLAVLQDLGGETLDVASDERQAAFAEADGRAVEALDVLRRALGRVHAQSQSLFEQRVKELEGRDAALRAAGVGSSVASAVERMRADFAGGHRLEAIAGLREADQKVGRIEGDWKGLQGLLRQIEGLRQSLKDTGSPIPEVEADILEVRRLLAEPDITIDRLDTASQTASRAIVLLHDALPVALEAELARHDQTLSGMPPEPAPVRRARDLHQEATRHLRRGRLNEATASLRELRANVLLLEKEPPIVVAKPTPAPAAPAVGTPEFLQRLLGTARDLAARVRSLPAESEIAYEAAGEIRLATELLRARKLEEADATLARLMRTLDAERPEAA